MVGKGILAWCFDHQQNQCSTYAFDEGKVCVEALWKVQARVGKLSISGDVKGREVARRGEEVEHATAWGTAWGVATLQH